MAAAELQHPYRPSPFGLDSTQGPRFSGALAYLSAFLSRGGAGPAHPRSSSPHLPLGEDVVSLYFFEFVCSFKSTVVRCGKGTQLVPVRARTQNTIKEPRRKQPALEQSGREARLAGLHSYPRAKESTRDSGSLGRPPRKPPDVHSTSHDTCAPGPHAGPAPHVRALNQPAAVPAPRARVHGGALLPAPHIHAAPLGRRNPALLTRRAPPPT